MQANTTVQNSVSMVLVIFIHISFSLTFPTGCPVHYQPLSLQFPDQFNQMRSRQLLNAQHRSWWPAPPCPPVTLQDEITAAIEEPLNLTPKPALKNSISHPIKYVRTQCLSINFNSPLPSISFMIPPDLIALISSHALLSSPFSPTILEIPSSFNLHRLSNLRDARLQTLPPKSPTPPTFPTQPSDHFPTRSNITDALHAAINSGSINTSEENKVIDRLRNSFLSGFTPETSVSLSLSLKGPTPFAIQSTMVSHLPRHPEHTAQFPTQVALPFWAPESPPIIPFYSSPPFTIGNLFLSSCPGKKGA